MANIEDGLLILHDHCEFDSDSSGKVLIEHAMDESTYKISAKRKHLWAIFENANRFEPLLLTISSFNKENDVIRYVSDVRSLAKIINDRILESGVKNLLQKVVDASNDTKLRSQAISYAKDLVCADKLPLTDMYTEAKKIFSFVKGNEYEVEAQDNAITQDE